VPDIGGGASGAWSRLPRTLASRVVERRAVLDSWGRASRPDTWQGSLVDHVGRRHDAESSRGAGCRSMEKPERRWLALRRCFGLARQRRRFERITFRVQEGPGRGADELVSEHRGWRPGQGRFGAPLSCSSAGPGFRAPALCRAHFQEAFNGRNHAIEGPPARAGPR